MVASKKGRVGRRCESLVEAREKFSFFEAKRQTGKGFDPQP